MYKWKYSWQHSYSIKGYLSMEALLEMVDVEERDKLDITSSLIDLAKPTDFALLCFSFLLSQLSFKIAENKCAGMVNNVLLYMNTAL